MRHFRARIAQFEVTELVSERKLRGEAFTAYPYANHEMETFKIRKGNLALRVDELKERLDNAQKKIEKKEKVGRFLARAQIIERIRGAYRSI